jgi:hypothetical protein
MRPYELERQLRERLDALGPLGCDALLAILEMPEDTLAKSRVMCELLIDCEKDPTLRAVLVGMLREADRGARRTGSQHPTSAQVPGSIQSG